MVITRLDPIPLFYCRTLLPSSSRVSAIVDSIEQNKEKFLPDITLKMEGGGGGGRGGFASEFVGV